MNTDQRARVALDILEATQEPPAPPPPPPAPEREPYPVDALPEPLAAYVRESAAAVDCPHEMVALPLLAALAACGRMRFEMRVKRKWPEPMLLWGAIICESGQSKTPAMQAGIQFLREIEMAERKAWRLECLAVDDRNQRRAKGADKEAYPTLKRHIIEKPTVEGLVQALEESTSVLVAVDELGGLIKDFDRYGGGGDGSSYISLYQGMGFDHTRKTPDATSLVDKGGVCVFGGLQPSVAPSVLGGDNEQNGFSARFMLAYPERRPMRWTDDEEAPETEEAVREIFTNLHGMNPPRDGSGAFTLTMTPEAKKCFSQFVNDLGAESMAHTGYLAAVHPKAASHAARLSIVLHVAENVAAEAGGSSPEVSADTMRRAIRLALWHKSEAERIQSLFGKCQVSSVKSPLEMVTMIEKAGGCIAPRTWMRKRGAKAIPTMEAAETDLQRLVDEGLAEWRERPPEPGKGGHTVRVLVLKQEDQQ